MLLRSSFAILVVGSTVLAACSDDGNPDGAGGSPGVGGTQGGSSGASTGGSPSGGTGGSAAGSPAGGGPTAGSAGMAGGAGMPSGGSGGSGGGGSPSGGASGASGASGAAGTAGAAGSGGGPATMSFFVTSKGGPKGGDFGGLEGADMFCKSLAAAVSSELGNKLWRAYLSTSTENARDRIGTGPWRNQAGQIIANNLDQLHSQDKTAGALNTTWPIASLSVALDEKGGTVPNEVHDILTGTGEGGKAVPNMTCNDWTSSAGTDQAQVGHSNRDGGGKAPSWTTTHPVGCAPSAENRQANTVTQGGGRGSIYCFAKGG